MEEEEILLSDPQYDFLTSKKKHTGFVAGFGSGKSFIGTLKSLLKIIDNGIKKTAYYLPTYGDIEDIAFVGFPEVAEMLGYDYVLNKSSKYFILLDENGKELGRTIFRNMSKPEGIVGYQVGYTLIDETDILNLDIMDKAFKKILGRNRLLCPVGDKETLEEFELTEVPPQGTYFHQKKKILCWINGIDVAGTPEGFKWFYKRFVKEFKEKTDLLIKASTYSNMDNLPDDFIETLRAEYPPQLFEAYVNGDFVNLTSGTVYNYFNRKTHHTDAEIEDHGSRYTNEILHISQDFNIGGCCGRVNLIRHGKPLLVEEYSVYDTHQIVNHLKDKYPNFRIIIYPDASGNQRETNASKTDIQILRDGGYEIDAPPSNPRVQDRVNGLNTMFFKNEYLVNTYNCPESTQSLEQQTYDKNGVPEKFDGANTVDDSNDSIGYFIARKFGIASNKVTSYRKKSI